MGYEAGYVRIGRRRRRLDPRGIVDKERDAKRAAKAPYLAVRDATARVERFEKREAKRLKLAAQREKEL